MCVWRGWKGSWVGRVSGTVGSVVVRVVVWVSGVQRRNVSIKFLRMKQNRQNCLLLLAELFILYHRDWTDGMAERQLNTNMIYFRLRTVKVLGMIHS